MTKPPTFAAGTDVPAERTRLDIERLVTAHGAEAYAMALDGHEAQIRFRMGGRLIRFDLPLPRADAPEFQRVRRGTGFQTNTPAQAAAARDKVARERWRGLLLTIKAKLTSVQLGIVTFEQEFLAHVVLPDGRTVGEVAARQLAIVHEGGEPPRLLADYTGGRG